jgi:oligopeptide transport system ATP-binding protein
MVVPPLCDVRDLKVHFPLRGGAAWLRALKTGAPAVVRAVDGVSFTVGDGETLGLVGESGCGKSTVARSLVRLVRPTAGTIGFDGTELTALSDDAFNKVRPSLQMVFQDPTASLNPRLSVRRMVEEPLKLHTKLGAAERRERTEAVLEEVGLGADLTDRYPHELSGGQRQRVNIARALVTNPRLLVLDEPTSALDVSLRARVILLLEELRARHGLSYLFISHDLATVRYLASRVAVMYLGVIVEEAETAELFDNPAHPYTRALLAAVPVPDRHSRRLPPAGPLSAGPAGLRRTRALSRGGVRPFRSLPSGLIESSEGGEPMTVVRYVLVKVRPGVSLDEFEKFEREVDYVKAAQNPSIVSYRTHRITGLDAGIEGGPWDFMERIEVTSQAEYEKQAASGSKEFLDLLYTKWLDRSKTVAIWSERIEP